MITKVTHIKIVQKKPFARTAKEAAAQVFVNKKLVARMIDFNVRFIAGTISHSAANFVAGKINDRLSEVTEGPKSLVWTKRQLRGGSSLPSRNFRGGKIPSFQVSEGRE
jgi:hypothetical protein